MGLKRGTVKLESYDKKWEESYLKEEKNLKQQLKDIIVEVHHVGSTSIKGLIAKPIIDILVVIKTFDKIVIFEEENHPKSLNSEEENFEHFKKTLVIYDECAKFLALR